jgi:hypothetical protein
LNFLDRFSSFELARRRNREDRLAFVHRLHGECALGLCRGHDAFAEHRAGDRAGQIFWKQNRFDAGHRHRGARVEARHARVRHRAEKQLRK